MPRVALALAVEPGVPRREPPLDSWPTGLRPHQQSASHAHSRPRGLWSRWSSAFIAAAYAAAFRRYAASPEVSSGCEASLNSRSSPVTTYETCSAMSTALSAMRSSARAAQHHAQPPLAPRAIAADLEHLLDDGAVEVVDEVVELVELPGAIGVAPRERVRGGLEHALAAPAHLLERTAHGVGSGLVVAARLHELGDRHALVGHALEIARDARRREDERDVAGRARPCRRAGSRRRDRAPGTAGRPRRRPRSRAGRPRIAASRAPAARRAVRAGRDPRSRPAVVPGSRLRPAPSP